MSSVQMHCGKYTILARFHWLGYARFTPQSNPMYNEFRFQNVHQNQVEYIWRFESASVVLKTETKEQSQMADYTLKISLLLIIL